MSALKGSRARCSTCPQMVVWVKTEARGQAMPLDPEPHPDGNVIMIDVPQTRHQVARVVHPADLPAPAPAYRAHFVTCANPPRRNHKPKRHEHNCQLCSWAVVARTKAEGIAAWNAHYAAEHLDRCGSCGARLIWIRAETDMRILALDPEPVDLIGQFILHPASTQTVAREIEPGLRGLRLHDCPTEGARLAPR